MATVLNESTGLPHDAMDELRRAKFLLENPSLAARLTSVIGAPIEKGLAFLPSKWSGAVQQITLMALRVALRIAVMTMGQKAKHGPSLKVHKRLAAISGAFGGALGFPGLAAELPVSTVIMLRSIADIARSEGERIKDIEVRLACLNVFAFSGKSARDDAAETGYYAVRAALARSVSEAVRHIAEKGFTDKGAPALVRLMTQIAARFNVAVSQKVAAQAVPIVGAVSGTAINMVFTDHFQKMARGHFIVRRLERTYGRAMVQQAYEKLIIE